MRSFFLFIIRHYVVFMFVLLEGIAFYLIFTFNSYHNTYFLNSANALTGNVLNTYGNFQEYFALRQVNDSLLRENSKLREQLFLAEITDTTRHVVTDSTGTPLYYYYPAAVIGNSFTEANNYITLNKGSNDGIEVDMGVITTEGIVGKVVKVSPNFSMVMSVLHSSFRSRVGIKRNNAAGRMQWDGRSPTHSNVIQMSEPGKLIKGDSIVTLSISDAFPPGILVGTMESYDKDPGSNYYNVRVDLSVNFSALRYVYVVKELEAKEKNELQQHIEDAGD